VGKNLPRNLEMVSELLEPELHWTCQEASQVDESKGMALLNAYCKSRPMVSLGPNGAPVCQVNESLDGYEAVVYMPLCVDPKFRTVTGEGMPTLSAAKSCAIRKMLSLLQNHGELDANLTPKVVQVEAELSIQRFNGLLLPKAFNNVLIPNTSVYINVIEYRVGNDVEVSTVGFTSFERIELDPFPFLVNSQELIVNVKTVNIRLLLDSDCIDLLKLYHRNLITAILRTKIPEVHEWAVYFVPLNVLHLENYELKDPQDLVDWKALEFCQTANELSTATVLSESRPLEEISEFVLYDEYRFKRNYLILNWTDLTPSTKSENADSRSAEDFYKETLNCTKEFDPNQKMILTEPLGYPFHSETQRKPMKDVHVIPSLAKICPIFKRHIVEIRKLPIIIQVITHRALMYEFHSELKEKCPGFDCTKEGLVHAFTSPSAHYTYENDRLEFLGDAVLKFLLSVYSFVVFPGKKEGFLSFYRNEMESNENLFRKSIQFMMPGLILTKTFNRKSFMPPSVISSNADTIGVKVGADAVEALFGVCYLDGGISSAVALANYFFEMEMCDPVFYKDLIIQPSAHECAQLLVNEVELVENAFGYRFDNLNWLAQALTHRSYNDLQCLNYERLEYLGDVVLSYVVSRFVYKLNDNFTPDSCSSLRGELVGNHLLGLTSIDLKLYSVLKHSIPTLEKDITRLKYDYDLKKLEFMTLTESEKSTNEILFWYEIRRGSKILGDIFESILGAIYIDSKFDIDLVEKIVKNTLIDRWLPYISALLVEGDAMNTCNPISSLFTLMASSKCFSWSLQYILSDIGMRV
jgi:dsRNA-specific ribonuclease